MTSTSASLMPENITMISSDILSSGEDNSIKSTVSEASSSDTDMDMDGPSDFRMSFSQSPEQSTSSWMLRPSPIRNPRMILDDQGTRVPTPIVRPALRPQHTPVQGPIAPVVHSSNHDHPRTHLGHAMERFPSPISEDGPHTPTTAAGSQLSLLTVTDIDMDMEPLDAPEPPDPPEPVTVRKQRQRSGAFTSPREPTKKLTMGYRDDCEKCRNRVPGHMNHFLGA